MDYVPDMTERYPDAGEPAEDREYLINYWVPHLIETRVYGTSKDDAVEELKEQLKTGRAVIKIVDRDYSEITIEETEEI